ncbi:MAG: type II toxin-antitoxin system Phd/YefM family antitoxin [Cyanobium sp. PLM2.Bin73]|nr:MAG: type II toxin-antitoxin system Phd/YefM family antitoxin [Cyanobium sp. PLM2.Bin73]
MQAVSLSEAKAQLAGLVHAAESGEAVHISRHGKAVAVLLSEQAYAALQGEAQGTRVWEAIAQWRRAGRVHYGDDWPGDLDIKTWRDRSVGREVELG